MTTSQDFNQELKDSLRRYAERLAMEGNLGSAVTMLEDIGFTRQEALNHFSEVRKNNDLER